jgi:serine/threonine protein kinase
MVSPNASGVRIAGRYVLCDEIAHGGMATVYVGRLVGSAGFARTVAIKRLHAAYARDPDFVSMFVDEARLAARIHHPNVVSTLDVVALEGELFLVMEYIQGESLARLERLASDRGDRIPEAMAASMIAGMLHGLHAAHEARDERGEPLGIVHRDVSPQNVLVGVDGVARVLDFGIAKAAGRIQTTRDGQLKGKLAYMSPEQLRGEVTRTTDVYAAGVVLWEALTGRQLFVGESEGELVTKVIQGCREAPTAGMSPELDTIALRALSRDPKRRFATARDMARALEDAVAPVATSKIGDWVTELAAATLLDRARRVESIEFLSAEGAPVPAADALTENGTDARSPRVSPAPMPVVEDVLLTQLTTGVTSHPAVLGLARTRGAWRAVGGALSLLLAALVGAGLLRRSTDAAGSAGSPPPSVKAVIADSVPAGAVASPDMPGQPATEPIASEAVTSAPTAPTPHAATAPASAVRRAGPHVVPTHGPRCDPPYYFDSQGVRIFKKECL